MSKLVPPTTAIDTSSVLSVMLERLNRASVVSLLEQMATELDMHCKLLGTNFDDKINALRIELEKTTHGLVTSTAQNQAQIEDIKNQIISLQNNLTTALADIDQRIINTMSTTLDGRIIAVQNGLQTKIDESVSSVFNTFLNSEKYTALQTLISNLQQRLTDLEAATKGLSSGQLNQVTTTVTNVLQHIDLGSVLTRMTVSINGKDYSLPELLEKLANQPRVQEVLFAHSDMDIISATFVLSTGATSRFTCVRTERPELNAIEYVFSTPDLVGLPAQFTLRFAKTTKVFSYCDKKVPLDQYEATYQSNVLYGFAKPTQEAPGKTLIDLGGRGYGPSDPAPSPTALIFWDPSDYTFAHPGDWNQWRYVSDGLGGKIGIKFGVRAGFATWNWSSGGGVAPHGSIGDSIGSASFGNNQQTGLIASSVNAVRMQLNNQFVAAVNNFTIDLDFSQYKGSKAGGVDGVAGANTFIGVSDIYAGQTYGKTVVTISCTLADGSAGSTAGWTLQNGGAVPSSAGGNQPAVQLSFNNGVLQGTSTPAPGGNPNSVDTVLGLLRLDAAGYKTVHLNYDISPVGNNRAPRMDNSGLYVATANVTKG